MCESIIKIDLRHDLVESTRAELILSGYSQDSVNRLSRDDREIIRALLNISRRWVSHNPRIIHKSKGFRCPQQHSASLSEIERAIRDGDDLTPYLSTHIIHFKFNDTMLNDWGIHHLHLGKKTVPSGKNKGFIQRTDPLLYCYFTASDAYLIAISDHNAFESRVLVEAMHENWPHVIEQFQARGAKGDRLTDEQVRELRRKRINHCVSVDDGTVYMPIGGGMTLSGSNLADVIETDGLLDWLRWAEDSVERFIRKEREIGRRHFHPIELRLCSVNGKYCVEDSLNGDLYVIRGDTVFREPLRRYKKVDRE